MDEDFISQSLQYIPEGKWWQLTCLEKLKIGAASWYHDCCGNTLSELEEELRDESCYGKLVAVGLEPPYCEDIDTIIDAYVPNADGTVTPGAY